MKRSNVKRVGKIVAVDDNGKRYTIYQYAESASVGSFQQADDRMDVATWLELPNGSRVNRINDTEFEIVISGKRLRAVG